MYVCMYVYVCIYIYICCNNNINDDNTYAYDIRSTHGHVAGRPLWALGDVFRGASSDTWQ